jgi:hypothetical protein
MTDPNALQIVSTALKLRQSHKYASARDILDLVMSGFEGSAPDFSKVGQPWDDAAHPPSPFAELLRSAFAPHLPAEDVSGFSSMDDARRDAFTDIWATEVIEPFAARYRLWQQP